MPWFCVSPPADSLSLGRTVRRCTLLHVHYTSFIYSLSSSTPRHRVKSSDLNLARSMKKVQALKEEVHRLEGENKVLSEENDRLKRVNEKAESTRALVQRKENQLISLRAQLDKAHSELADAKRRELASREEFDKSIT